MAQRIRRYNREYYYPESDLLTPAKKREEYERLRIVINARLEEFKGTKYEASQTYLRNAGKFVPAADVVKDSDISKLLYDAYRFVSAKTSTVKGVRSAERKAIATLKDRGYNVTAKNFDAFTQYMEEARLRGLNAYGSTRVADLFTIAQHKELDPRDVLKDFGYWYTNRKELENMPKIRNKNQRNADEYRRRINSIKKKNR